MLNIIGIGLALLLLCLGEMMKNETKVEYENKGYNWSVVLFSSISAGLIGGVVMTIILHYVEVSSIWNPHLLTFAATIASYVTIQSFMTDLRVLLINRKLLRVAYLSMYGISIYNVMTNDFLSSNRVALALFTVVLIVIFIFSSIGASDVRAIAVMLPYVISIGGYDAILLFVATLLLVSLSMGVRNIIRDRGRMRQFKEDNIDVYNKMNKILFYKFARDLIKKEQAPDHNATPVGPYMITPFLIFIFAFPFIVN